MSGRTPGRTSFAMLLAGLGLLAACSSDNKAPDSDEVFFDSASGDEVAHAALPVLNELPGGRWELMGEDSFSTDTGKVDTQACAAVSGSLYTAWATPGEQRLARAQREFGHLDDPFSSLDVQVTIFNDTETPEAALEHRRAIFESGDFDTCFAESIEDTQQNSGVSGGAQPPSELRKVDAQIKVPSGGVSRAYDARINVEGMEVIVHFEIYEWRYGNAGVTVILAGDKDRITEELVETTVDDIQDKLEAQAKN